MEWVIFFIIIIWIISESNDEEAKRKKESYENLMSSIEKKLKKEKIDKDEIFYEETFYNNIFNEYIFDNTELENAILYDYIFNKNLFDIEDGDIFLNKYESFFDETIIYDELFYNNIFDGNYFDNEVKTINLLLKKYDIKYIYHMTHIDNFENILTNGLLSHTTNLVNKRIDNAEVNARRNFIEPIYNKNVHDYVPFYINPKNAMLFVRKNIQDNLIILLFDNNLISQKYTLFTDGNSAVHRTKFFNKLNDLDKLNWECLHSEYWSDFEDGKRLKMAEVLVPQYVGIENLKAIICHNEDILYQIQSMGINIPVFVDKNKKFYFRDTYDYK